MNTPCPKCGTQPCTCGAPGYEDVSKRLAARGSGNALVDHMLRDAPKCKCTRRKEALHQGVILARQILTESQQAKPSANLMRHLARTLLKTLEAEL